VKIKDIRSCCSQATTTTNKTNIPIETTGLKHVQYCIWMFSNYRLYWEHRLLNQFHTS